ncbi:MAG: hypothetical protein IJ436_03025 [Bacteroidaceae bacterium]|nr:hypothetical protein [Bacteroidaceae bacterium]
MGKTPHIPNYETKEYTVKGEDFACPIQAGTFMDMIETLRKRFGKAE